MSTSSELRCLPSVVRQQMYILNFLANKDQAAVQHLTAEMLMVAYTVTNFQILIHIGHRLIC